MTELTRWLRNQWDRVCAGIAVIAGGLSLLFGYLGVSRGRLVTQQVPYLASGGFFGVFALGVGATLWLSADLRDEWRKLDDIHRDQQRLVESATPEPLAHPQGPAESTRNGRRTGSARPARPPVRSEVE